MSAIETIRDRALAGVREREQRDSFARVKQLAEAAPAPKDGYRALRCGPGAVSIMAEIKRSSPGTGPLAPIEDPAQLAAEYEAGGARAISCLTAAYRYGGALSDLDAVSQAVSIPVLRKDIILTPYQIHEARAHGADMILLIVSFLSDDQLRGFVERTTSLGMTPVVEAHSRLEALRAIDSGARVIGINARDLLSNHIDRDNFSQVVDVLPADVVAVAESGVRDPRDVFEYASAGADCVLIGEALVTSKTPRTLVGEMVSAAQHPAILDDRKERVKRTVHQRHSDGFHLR
ncbi:indole-3-glycerol phosphate synthase TrpC [Gleimia hominis]|uniref:indole-3-glycerol-phosphate synthase n=1 Tax=Gleimia hominis TaxID=595468 RepID=A0ABU3IB44_9ACTO|nr:indole-3-glycerol phosphate synthase TrpC [Gleimia hominis]MDT3767592.1 indole-3-glycerol phosphate synthase TrpC [Gleimia hominis]